MKRRFVFVASVLLISACAQEPAEVEPEAKAEMVEGAKDPSTAPGEAPTDAASTAYDRFGDDPALASCNASDVRVLIGQRDTPIIRTRIEQKAKIASSVRYVMPGEEAADVAIPDRLNVMIGPDGKVSDVSCG